jgi:peptide/nickel transport system substrate-binding protein
MKKILLFTFTFLAFAMTAQGASCPSITRSDNMGIANGAFPQQYELSEFESATKGTMTFQENPAIKIFNGKIRGNPSLPALSDRLPAEPLVVVPYDKVGTYGGTLDMISNATESGTTDVMSIRHVNLVRYADDLQTIVPNIAKAWKWNDDFTQLTFFLRKGHKWSDGAPFTAEDVKFWYDNLALDTNVIAKPKDYVLVDGKRMTIEVIDAQTVSFNLPAPKPGLLSHFAVGFAQPFQPKHFLGKFHPDINPNADKLAKSIGFENGYAVIKAYYGNSDWMDTPTPMLSSPDKVDGMPAATAPTLESHIIISESTEGRHMVANPYFHMVDTAGNQLPYIGETDEIFVGNSEVRLLKLVNAEVTYKAQALNLDYAPMLLDNQKKGNFTVELKPAIGLEVFAFNVTSADLAKRKIFGDLKFRQAMSIAINRDEINEVAYFGLGAPQQYIAFSPTPSFVSDKLLQYYTEFDPSRAKSMLDEIGLVDKNGNGWRDLPNGDPLILDLQVPTQGISMKLVELVGQHWKNVGVKTTVKEVTTDEFRSAQSANKLDVVMYSKGQPLAKIIGIAELFLPPFDDYFTVRTGMLWGEYLESNGASGVKPPAYVYQMIDDIGAFQSAVAGSDESNALGVKLVEAMTKNLLFIGTVKGVLPIYHSNTLKNFAKFKVNAAAYYRAYPHLPSQWYLEK